MSKLATTPPAATQPPADAAVVVGSICRAELPTGLDADSWLAGRSEDRLWYWSERDRDDKTAAAGVLVEVAGDEPGRNAEWVAAIEMHLRDTAPGVRFYGGARFDGRAAPTGRWRHLGAYRFAIPRFEARTQDGLTTLACNFRPEERRRLPELLTELATAASAPATPPVELMRITDLPRRDEWNSLIQLALAAIANPAEPLHKVVLARRTSVATTHTRSATPFHLLRSMSRDNDRAFRFMLQLSPRTAFVGVTPEQLFQVSEGRVRTEAVAGTRRRGRDRAEDDRLRVELMTSPKDQLEHRYVHDAISAALDRLCTCTSSTGIDVLRLPTIQHLVTELTGQSRPGVGLADLMGSLHPTPAVGGAPAAAAERFRGRHEPFDRGWYAGPVGWVAEREARFAVAIRSALVADGQLELYTGNGVVAGSTPEGEWEELETKIGRFLTTSAS